MPFSFELMKTCAQTGARLGVLHTPHGDVQTPAFMPVGTQAAVKAMTPRDLQSVGASVILANTYHLAMRPGHERIREAGGLHRFMAWDGPILTDSGGFQVFSLSGTRAVMEEGVEFRSHIDGSRHFFTPETVMEIETALGADIIMAFDECAPYPSDEAYTRAAMARTHAWARRCRSAQEAMGNPSQQALFGIVQGGFFSQLRKESARAISDFGFPGNAIGGLSVGEPKPLMYEMLEDTTPLLPKEKPRYLMGVGSPDCLLEGTLRGIDMFDCVLPTRCARNGLALTAEGNRMLRNAEFERDFDRPIEEGCDCYACAGFSRGYIRHLIKAKEILAAQLITIHNLRFTLRLMERIREAIREDRLLDFAREWIGRWGGSLVNS